MIQSNDMVVKALNIMEDFSITQLIVSDDSIYKGVIHLHDIFKRRNCIMADKNTKEMSFLDHLEKLRWMLVRSVSIILVLAIVAFSSVILFY